jgi:hypothetical protein
MANITSEMAELKMVALNISAVQQQHYDRLEVFVTHQLDILTANLTAIGDKLDTLVSSSSSKDIIITTLTAERDALMVERDALKAQVDASPAEIQAVADQVGVLSAKLL